MDAPAVGDLAGKGADALLDGIAHYPESAARAEVKLWLAEYGAGARYLRRPSCWPPRAARTRARRCAASTASRPSPW